MFNDFKLDNENEVEKEEKKKFFGLSKLQILLIILILLGIIIIIAANGKKKAKEIRIDDNKDLVYSSYVNEMYDQRIPYVNVKGDEIIELNEDIQKYTKEFKDNKKAKIKYEYQYQGGFYNLLSLIISIKYSGNDNNDRFFYASYNVDVVNKKWISSNDVLKAYGLTQNDVKNYVKDQFKEFYNDEIKNNYFEKKDCNFVCYLDLRNYNGIEDGEYSYYVDNTGKLKLYLPFLESSIYNEQNYFDDKDHIFILKDKPE